MANRYRSAQFDLTTTNATDIYTVPSESRAIIQNIQVANVGGSNVELKGFVLRYVSYQELFSSFAEQTINTGTSRSLNNGTIILEESDKLQLQAATADIFEGTVSILEFDRT